MVSNRQATFGVIGEIIRLANPVFILMAVSLPLGVYIYAYSFGPLIAQNYVHVMTGGLWTGIDLFMGFVLGPVLGGMEPKDRASVFKRLIPRMTFLMPVLAGVTATSGIQFAQRMGLFSLSSPWILAALTVTAILTIQGFGILLPNEVRIFRQLLSDKPDIERIARLGMTNAKLGGVQGVFQLAIIFIMANIRF
ncbi:MAG: hypothetical protein HYU86_04550 [Chloroflexi bacterium]|nr:hypothetical protein [Chloroflexota bacterium]